MKKRFLIVSADDFGISESTNAAIRELFDGEKITSAGILAPADFALDACRLARENRYSVGVHWTLNSEWANRPWSPLAPEAGSLLEKGFLTADMARVKQAKAEDVTRELEAQYQFLAREGCTPDHADSHCGTLYGTNGRLFFLNAFALCRKHRLPFRFSKSDAFLKRQFEREPEPLLRLARRAVTGCAALQGVRLPGDFYSDPRPVSRIGSPEELRAYYERQLATLTGDICEVFMHPSLPGGELLDRSPEWKKRVWEYEYLKSGQLRAAAEKMGFALVSWGEAPF